MTVLGKCGWKLHQNNIQVLLQLENSRTKIISLFIEAVVHGGRERREGCETEGFGKKVLQRITIVKREMVSLSREKTKMKKMPNRK